MATVVFVHGTGVRQADNEATVSIIEQKLQQALAKAKRGNVQVISCPWGDSVGIKLNAGGRSIPDYQFTGQLQQEDDREKEEQILLWEMLYDDPLYELRGLALRSKPRGYAFDTYDFDELVQKLPSPKLQAVLERAGMAATFIDARDFVFTQPEYQQTLNTSTDASDCRGPVARAMLAKAASLCDENYIPPAVLFDPTLRDDIVELITGELGQSTRSAVGWAANLLFKLAQELGATELLQSKRGRFMDAVSPATGDILLYQANGQPIRTCIRRQIKRAASPVVLIGHSLGGIACVDLIVKRQLPAVALLVTVGSQAPFLYEINALYSLRYNEPIPKHFPRWINIYDRRDFLSFVGETVFPREPGEAPPIVDIEVDNRLPFPESHSGYWANPETWEAIVPELP